MKHITSYHGNLAMLLPGVQSWLKKAITLQKLVLISLLLCLWNIAEAAPKLGRNPIAGVPTAEVTINGSGFSAYEAVDVYFDTDDLCLAATDGAGAFSCTLQVPREAIFGTHWLTAVGRKSGSAAQKSFLVRVNWSQFHYGSGHRGYNPFENILSPVSVADLNDAWIFSTGGEICSSPVVAEGLVYVGSEDGNLYVINARTGALKWKKNIGCGCSSPAVANGTVFVRGNGLYALNAKTGDIKWSYNPIRLTHFSPTVADGMVYVDSVLGNGEAILAIDAKTGVLQWEVPVGNWITSSPTVANGKVYVGTDSHYIALEASTGKTIWDFGLQDFCRICATPAVAGGMVYVGLCDEDNKIYALRAKDGAVKWGDQAGAVITSPSSSPTVAGGLVYVGSAAGMLAFDIILGGLKWTYDMIGMIHSSPAVANGVLYVGSDDGQFYALDSKTGEYKWSYNIGSEISSSPAVANGMVYVGSKDGNLYCFSLDLMGISILPIPRPNPALLIPDRRLEPQVER